MTEPGYPIALFADYCGALETAVRFDTRIAHIVTDTRNYRHVPGSVFFAIRGEFHDGHRFLQDIYRAGMRNFVVSDPDVAKRLPEANVIVVEDTAAALKKLAAAHRRNFDYPLVAITGSNGKTVVKEWLFHLLYPDYHIVRNPKSFNSQIGVPLAVWAMGDEHELAIFEAGISLPGEMKNLEAILKPTIGIFTNIGRAHQENFPDLRTKVREKLRLFHDASLLVYCRDHALIAEEIEHTFQGRTVSWSARRDADLHISKIAHAPSSTELHGEYRGNAVRLELPFTDAASIENACHCLALLLGLGMDPETIAERMKKLAPVSMRLEQREGLNGCTVINDTYNSDINSLEIALDFLRRQGKNSRKVAIVSDILQSGESPGELYGKVAAMIRNKGVDRFVGIGPDISGQKDLFAGVRSDFYTDTESFLENLPLHEFANEDILVKGSRAFVFERIVDALQWKSHETVLEIDLAKVISNLNRIRSALPAGVKIMAVVKAFAYGSGSFELARLLEYNRVDYLAVAYTDEGVALREAGIALPILVLSPEISGYGSMISHRLEPLIHGFRSLEAFGKARKHHGANTPHPIHIKINTGMHRLGFEPGDMAELGAKLASDDALTVKTVFSHLAGSERPDYDAFSRQQMRKFEQATEELRRHLPAPFARHILNSAGALRHQEATYDMVRVGLALHGLSASAAHRDELEPVARLSTSITQIRSIAEGDKVGYAPGQVPGAGRIAVLPIGYADGLRRSLGFGKGRVFINGQYAPFVGSICMDMAMVDVTDVECSEGDSVEVFGEHISVYELAEAMDTIPYEVLTGISTRVKRVFLTE